MRFWVTDRNVLCIDWDERSLRVVDARLTRAGVRIRKAVHAPLDERTDIKDPASLGGFLRRTLGEHRIRTRRAIVDIPRQDAVVNLLNLPDASMDELAAMVHIQIVKELPFAKDQAVIDFAVSREAGASTCEVCVSAVRGHVTDHYQQVIRAAGLKLERIGLRPYANAAAVAAHGVTEGRTLMIDVGPSMTEINVSRDGRLVYSRAASVSMPTEGLSVAPRVQDDPSVTPLSLADDAGSRPRSMETLLIEVSRTVEAYRSTDPGAAIDRIVLSGTAGVDRAMRAAFEKRFHSPTTIYEAPSSVRWRPPAGESAAPFSAAIGLAISNTAEGTLHFDFLHPKEPDAGRRERARRVPMMAATIALFVAAGGVLAYYPISWRDAEVESLDAQISKLDRDRKERNSFMKKYAVLEEWQKHNVVWIDMFQQVAEALPPTEDAYLNKLECSGDKGTITLELAAKNREVALGFIERVKDIEQQVMSATGKERTVHPFSADLGEEKVNPQDPKYPVKRTVKVQIESLKETKKSKRR